VTPESGQIRDKQQDKWRQINRYVETLAQLVRDSNLSEKRELSIVDMGCGKGYLTFAAYDYFKNICGIDVTVTGIDTKTEIVDLCNGIAKSCGFDGLSFVKGWIETFEPGNTDILIALHACDTATDDAIFKGIKAGAELIVAAPCCHKEIRGQIKPPELLNGILRHGIMLERTAETITDGLRSLLLEKSGYSTKIFEFISTEHTPKNNMLVGIKSTSSPGGPIQKQIDEIKSAFGISHQKLETLLNS
jgi:SAM-dependent methyltransferase